MRFVKDYKTLLRFWTFFKQKIKNSYPFSTTYKVRQNNYKCSVLRIINHDINLWPQTINLPRHLRKILTEFMWKPKDEWFHIINKPVKFCILFLYQADRFRWASVVVAMSRHWINFSHSLELPLSSTNYSLYSSKNMKFGSCSFKREHKLKQLLFSSSDGSLKLHYTLLLINKPPFYGNKFLIASSCYVVKTPVPCLLNNKWNS